MGKDIFSVKTMLPNRVGVVKTLQNRPWATGIVGVQAKAVPD